MPTSTTDPIGPTAAPACVREALEAIEGEPRLDHLADALAGFGRRLSDSALGSYVRGEAVGHSMHATIAGVRTGVLASSLVAGLVGGRSGQKVAGRLAAIGVVMSVPSAVTFAVELADEDDTGTRRVAAAYAATSAAAGLFFFRGWLSRARSHGFRGVIWSLIGAAPLGLAAFLGGHLAGARGFGAGPRGLDAPVVRPAPGRADGDDLDAAHDDSPDDGQDAPHAAIRAL